MPAFPADPVERFQALFARAAERAPFDHTAVALATADADGRPSVRVVLLRHVDERGFVFFTNYESRKGAQIAANPHGALCAYWPWLDEQARVEGKLSMIDARESDDYFAGRPRGSQIGAWASRQSEVLSSRADLEAAYARVDREYADQLVPRPPHWGGYRLAPALVEFWQAGDHRLHDRQRYTRAPGGWRLDLLYP